MRLAKQQAANDSCCMAEDTLPVPAAGPQDMTGSLAWRLARYFKAQVEDWYDLCRRLTDWEDLHLVDVSTPERLAEHKRLLDELEGVGRWLARGDTGPRLPGPNHRGACCDDPPGLE